MAKAKRGTFFHGTKSANSSNRGVDPRKSALNIKPRKGGGGGRQARDSKGRFK